MLGAEVTSPSGPQDNWNIYYILGKFGCTRARQAGGMVTQILVYMHVKREDGRVVKFASPVPALLAIPNIYPQGAVFRSLLRDSKS